jgi:inosine/xanthosine triphosphate pyrophosphatase family protein
MQNKTDRNANFTDALAYYDPRSQELQVFESITHGTIANDPSNNDGPTTDRLFVPAGHDKPLADIPEDERTKVWNTDRWQHLVDFLRSRTN